MELCENLWTKTGRNQQVTDKSGRFHLIQMILHRFKSSQSYH